MVIFIRIPEEIEIMRTAGKILASVLSRVVSDVKPGISTFELDGLAEDLIVKAGAKPAFKGYPPPRTPASPGSRGAYPHTLCTSINEQVVHAIPSKDQVIQSGDIIGLDCGVLYQGYYADMAVTIPVGKISSKAKRLIKVTKKSLDIALNTIKPGIHLGDLSYAVQSYVEKNGFSVVRQLSGHGIGKNLHEEPTILNYGKPDTGIVLKQGMTVAIEPMVNIGHWKVKTLDDGWTVATDDGSLSAHFEHTIVITKKGCEVLTKI
ncbi:type I methionyl aminopeptidase [Patescibacteria group bacterium AH-259-L07]|nr:type I methionyl aminopeptidase [Patescibacteria group bacterium AH-259-L07]